ncbi:isochorismatase family protein [Saccharopolyspora rosea]|uniref:Isochorismatase family protein n=1 Tax=Saccharopolyspora rosea TaxID=524884 RepID=A0ABW3FQ21_9PSEU|nr:isochorismatase family protein [Saccharopolyspora rosea]
MALPAIAPYRVPQDDLPANRVGWRPDPDRAVLLIHDMERHFVGAFTPGAEPLSQVVPNIRLLRETARAAGVPVVYCAQPGGQTPRQRGLQLEWWGPGVADPEQAEIIDELAPGEGDVLMTKWRYSAFLDTELADLLRDWGRDQLVITGIYAHIGCLMTAAEAFQRDVQAFLAADAVADFSPEEHRMALSYAAKRCAVVDTSRQLARSLAADETEVA